MNERKTENIIRNHFGNYLDQVLIEEQSSDNYKISKLLAGASKAGQGKGKPEFIIQFKDEPDLLIVIECKPDVTKHESKDRHQYKDYAVDGVLLYSSFLSKEFDVIAIAVSGSSQDNLRMSHFLQLKGENKAVEKFGNSLLPPKDYLDGYRKVQKNLGKTMTNCSFFKSPQ